MKEKIKKAEMEKRELAKSLSIEIDQLKMKLVNQVLEMPAADFATLSEFVSARKAAELLGVSMPTLHRYSQRGILKRYVLGNKTYYRQDELSNAIKLQNIKNQEI